MTLSQRPIPLAVLAAAFAALLAASAGPRPAAADPFLVRDVRVDATAANAIAAREQAVDQAQRIALGRLMERLTGNPAPPPGADAQSLVQGIEVQEERTSAVRYVGTLAVRFSPQAVRRALDRAGVPFVAAESPPVLVLPLLVREGQPVLWQERTPWRGAWDASPPSGLVPVLVPFGELADAIDAPTEEVAALDPAALSRIGQRYGAGAVLVARATQAGDGPGRTVEVLRVPVGAVEPPVERTVDVPAGAADPWAAAMRAVAEDLDRQWREQTQIASGPEERIVLRVPFAGMQQWMEIRRRLTQVPQVAGADVETLTRQEAVVVVRYRGGAERLRDALAQRRLLLEPGAPGQARLVLAGG